MTHATTWSANREQVEDRQKLAQAGYDTNSVKCNLSKWGLTKIPSQVLEMEHLQELNLSHNAFTEVPLEFLNQFSCLQKVDLSFNKIKSIPDIYHAVDVEKNESCTSLMTAECRYKVLREGEHGPMLEIILTGNPLPKDFETFTIGFLKFIKA